MKLMLSSFDGSESMQMPLLKGDLVIHFLSSMFESENGGIGDFWVMKGGENFAITSNESDFPPGFELSA